MTRRLIAVFAMTFIFTLAGFAKSVSESDLAGKWEGMFNGVVLSFDFGSDKKFTQSFGGKKVQEGKWQLKKIKGNEYVAVNSKKDGLGLYIAELDEDILKLTFIVGAAYSYGTYTFGSDAEVLELKKAK
ncbi:MAG: hypothetical protein A2Y33_03950 [Spirochaetes bacterium GWF1_51_8]|nr:MAG: hypothetical protein A2Y33_03950 [Spirochaetes bacterium GWF1_51_8]